MEKFDNVGVIRGTAYFAKNASLVPAVGVVVAKGKVPPVYPVIYTLLFRSIATPQPSSSKVDPNCFVHILFPLESYFAKNAS